MKVLPANPITSGNVLAPEQMGGGNFGKYRKDDDCYTGNVPFGEMVA